MTLKAICGWWPITPSLFPLLGAMSSALCFHHDGPFPRAMRPLNYGQKPMIKWAKINLSFLKLIFLMYFVTGVESEQMRRIGTLDTCTRYHNKNLGKLDTSHIPHILRASFHNKKPVQRKEKEPTHIQFCLPEWMKWLWRRLRTLNDLPTIVYTQRGFLSCEPFHDSEGDWKYQIICHIFFFYIQWLFSSTMSFIFKRKLQ